MQERLLVLAQDAGHEYMHTHTHTHTLTHSLTHTHTYVEGLTLAVKNIFLFFAMCLHGKNAFVA